LANLIGGWLATRFGIARMLTVGLVTQIIGFGLLSALQSDWTAAMSVAWVVLAQGVCGVAKDLTKTASKSGNQDHPSTSQGHRQRPIVQVGGMVHWQQKRHEGLWIFLRRFAARDLGFSGLAVGHVGPARLGADRRSEAACHP
jgi:hypothetical protein